MSCAPGKHSYWGQQRMTAKELVTASKFLSKHLRHDPAALGLTLADGGWVDVQTLLDACARHGFPITREQLDEIVRTSDKKRFAFDETGLRIRANQGHSTPVDLQLQPIEPPAVLYHGSACKNEAAILGFGLLKMKRHHVHLSLDVASALKVGARHGTPVLFAINSAAMHAQGFVFYCSANGVWLTDHVPPQFLRVLEET
jgi:putative RNA 2'-phosphotransferase